MSNLTIAYANTVGVKLPETFEDYPTHFIPIPEKYIVVYNGGDFESFKYDYFDKALSLIRPYLGDIKIVQIGIPNDKLLAGAEDYRGKSNFKQTCFIVENSELVISGDSVWNYVAGAKGVPFIALFGPTPAASSVPHYKGQYEILESHRNGEKPSYEDNETPKSINLIKPEEIASRAAGFLGVEYDKIITKRIGHLHNMKCYDYIPDCPPMQFPVIGVCRMDVNYNMDNLARFLAAQRGAVVTDKPINLDFLVRAKNQIADFVILVDLNFPLDYIKHLHKTGISYKLVCHSDEKELADVKAKFFDYNQVHSKPPVDLTDVLETDLFDTNRLYYGRGKTYKSLYHYKNDIEFSDNQVIGNALNTKDFQETVSSLHIYNYA